MNILSILETDFIEVCKSIISGELNDLDIIFKNLATVCKYAVPDGYPDKPVKGNQIDVSNVKKNYFFCSSSRIHVQTCNKLPL